MFLEKLKKAGAVDDAVFSLMINSDDNIDSKITLGGYNSEKFGKEGSRVNWHPLKPREMTNKYDHWRLDLSSIYFGDSRVTNSVVDSVIVDSGTSLLLMPEHEFKMLMDLIMSVTDVRYTFKNDFGLEAFPCTKDKTYAKLPHITFLINGLKYSVPPASYIGYKAGTCTMKIMTNKRDKTFVTLGLNFFENYYSIFDIENKMIGLQTAKTSKNGLSLD